MKNLPADTSRGDISVVVLMALGFGLVGIDRFLISTLYPVIARDLHLSYTDIGTITGALAVAWGLSALVMGNASDRIGRRTVLVGSLVVFSLLIGVSGLAQGVWGLVLVRVLMGFADGAFTPASICATLEASPAQKQGRNIGVQQMTLTLFGLGIAPLLVSELLHVINWRWIFSLFVVPGLILALLSSRTIPAPAQPNSHQPGTLQAWRMVLRYRSIWVLMLCMLCWLTCLVTTSAFMPSYLTDRFGLATRPMAQVMSAIGIGSAVGTLSLPWLSDAVGRKYVMAGSSLGALLSLIALSRVGNDPTVLFWALFCVHFFNNALITLTVGPLSAAAVPAQLTATASGLVIAVGELLGGGLGPIAAGQIAQRLGIAHLLWLPMGAVSIGSLLCCFGLASAGNTGTLLRPR